VHQITDIAHNCFFSSALPIGVLRLLVAAPPRLLVAAAHPRQLVAAPLRQLVAAHPHLLVAAPPHLPLASPAGLAVLPDWRMRILHAYLMPDRWFVNKYDVIYQSILMFCEQSLKELAIPPQNYEVYHP